MQLPPWRLQSKKVFLPISRARHAPNSKASSAALNSSVKRTMCSSLTTMRTIRPKRRRPCSVSAMRSPDRRIIVAFQPHLFTRTRDQHDAFGGAFANCDVLLVTDIYASREKPIEGVNEYLHHHSHPNLD